MAINSCCILAILPAAEDVVNITTMYPLYNLVCSCIYIESMYGQYFIMYLISMSYQKYIEQESVELQFTDFIYLFLITVSS